MDEFMEDITEHKKKILFLMLSVGVGGAERQVVDLINRLDSNIFSLSVIYFKHDTLGMDNLKIDTLEHIAQMQRKGKFDFSGIKVIKNFIQNNHIDIVFCVEEFPFLIGFLAKALSRHKFKLVTAIHHTKPFPGLWQKIKDIFYYKLLNYNNSLVFVSQNQMDYWISENGINPQISTLIHNGIDVNSFSPDDKNRHNLNLKQQLRIPEDHFVVGISAFIREEKRHVDLVDAIALCHKRNPRISACIIGQGELKEYVEDYVKQKKLDKQIIFTGFKHDVRPYINICDCMCLISDTEAFSIASLEAMALKKIIILSDVGGANEQVNDGVNGYLFQPRDVKKLAELILLLAEKNTPIESMQNNARQTVCDKFSLTVMVKKYSDLFLSL